VRTVDKVGCSTYFRDSDALTCKGRLNGKKVWSVEGIKRVKVHGKGTVFSEGSFHQATRNSSTASGSYDLEAIGKEKLMCFVSDGDKETLECLLMTPKAIAKYNEHRRKVEPARRAQKRRNAKK